MYQGSGILSLNRFHGLGFILLPLLSNSSLQKVNILSIQGLEKGVISALNSSINSSCVRTAAGRAEVCGETGSNPGVTLRVCKAAENC